MNPSDRLHIRATATTAAAAVAAAAAGEFEHSGDEVIRSGPKPQTRGWTHSDRGKDPTQTGIRHPNQTGPRPHSDRAPSIPAESIRALPPCHGVNGMGRRFFLAVAWKGMGAPATHHSQRLSSCDSIEGHCGWKPVIEPGPFPLYDVIERHVAIHMLLHAAPCHHAMAQLASPTHFCRNHPSHPCIPEKVTIHCFKTSPLPSCHGIEWHEER